MGAFVKSVYKIFYESGPVGDPRECQRYLSAYLEDIHYSSHYDLNPFTIYRRLMFIFRYVRLKQRLKDLPMGWGVLVFLVFENTPR